MNEKGWEGGGRRANIGRREVGSQDQEGERATERYWTGSNSTVESSGATGACDGLSEVAKLINLVDSYLATQVGTWTGLGCLGAEVLLAQLVQ